MLADCRSGALDMIITKSISRFARNTVTLLEIVRELKSLGVDVYFEEQNIHTLSADGELILTILSIVLSVSSGRLEALAGGYILVFLINLIRAGFHAAEIRSKESLLFFLGLLLFFCCDLCVGWYHIGNGPLWSFARVAMWGFYLPWQILILLSDLLFQGDHI